MYEEIGGNGGGNNEDREFVSAKIGSAYEGVFKSMSKLLPSQFGDGEYRIVSLDLTDGRKVALSAGKILLEKFEAAGLNDGDKVKIEVGSATSKAGRTYALPRLYVQRGNGSTPPPAAQQAPAAPVVNDEPDF